MTDTFRLPPFEDENQCENTPSGSGEPAGSLSDPFSDGSFSFEPDPAPVSEPEVTPVPEPVHDPILASAPEDPSGLDSLLPAEQVPAEQEPAVAPPAPPPSTAPKMAPAAKQGPTVYFIDDSATMREVMKIAFRKERIHLIACPDAASALSQFESNPPDAVITDVIMPDQDGYSVCSQIKQNPRYSSTPVLLMSGVVNKTVADRAVAVHADELLRKPFQPQELIARVRSLLHPKSPAPQAHPPSPARIPAPPAANPLGSLFAPPAAPPPRQASARPPAASETAWPRALAEAFTPQQQAQSAPQIPHRPVQPAAPQRPAAPAGADIQKYRAEILRLELLVKKLQTELQIEREYTQTLEAHFRALQGVD